MENQKALKLVNRNLKIIQEELKTIALFGTQFDVSSGNINEIRVRLEALSTISEKFEAMQTEAENLDDTVDEDTRIAERVDFRNHLYNVKAILMQLLDTYRNTTSSSPSYSELTKHKTETSMKLPPIDIPKFNGD